MSNRKNAYTEVYTILQELNEEEYNKIPPEVLKTIEANRNREYEYELDDELELKEQPIHLKQKQYYLIYLEIILQTQSKELKL